MIRKQYVLITPAKNEEKHIAQTIEAILSQTLLPHKWIIVSDGSTDQTDGIVAKYAQKHRWIELVTSSSRGQKDFGSKVRAFRAGYDQLRLIPYQFIGNLDADVTFGANYYEQIIERFTYDGTLGIAGGIILELINNKFTPQHASLNSVAGAVQLFRRQCYEDIGGYIPIRSGGIDAAAEILARKHGWTVRTFREMPVLHHRRVSTGRPTILSARFHQGVTNYLLGYHPLFQTISSLSRMCCEQPYIIGSLSSTLGYVCCCLKRPPRVMPDDAITFLRSEQLARLADSLTFWKTKSLRRELPQETPLKGDLKASS